MANNASKRLTALELGRFLGSVEAIPLLSDVIQSTECAATAAKAKQIIESLSPGKMGS